MTAWTLTSAGNGQNKSSGTTLTLTTTTAFAVGDWIALGVGFDNLSTNTPTVTGVSVSSGALDTPIVSAHCDSPQSGGGAGVRAYLHIAKVTSAISSGATVTITFSSSITAKGAGAVKFSGPSLVEVAQGPDAQTATSGSITNIDAVTPVNTTDGNLMVTAAASEVPSIISWNGLGITAQTGGTSGSGSASNASGGVGLKIHDVDDTADDRYGPNITDGGTVFVVLRELSFLSNQRVGVPIK